MIDEKPRIRVLIVEDHIYTANGLQEALGVESDIQVLGASGTAASGLIAANELNPHVIMLDLHLPGRPPITQLIKDFSDGKPWKIIVFSAETRTAFVEAALEMGAKAFLSKSELPEKVIDCIRAVYSNRSAPIVSAELRRDLFSLSPGLEEVLSLLGKGLKYHEIAAIRYSAPETIRKQCERLQIKLGLSSREQLIAWAVNNGYASLD